MGTLTSFGNVNLFMEALEYEWLTTFNIDPRICWLYVDNRFVVIERDQIKALTQLLNSYHPKTDFTIEYEDNDKCFIDCHV